MSLRTIEKVVLSRWQAEGRGAKVRRSIGGANLRNLDPFLLLDEFDGGEDGSGFPDHPHRGFETVTYLLKGIFLHEDFLGNKGKMTDGCVQWMTAGRGIVHSEMPAAHCRGLQLWVNLASKNKMIKPAWQDLTGDEIPTARTGGVSVKIISGESMGVKSGVKTLTPTTYLDFSLEPGCEFKQAIPQGWTAFAYTLQGLLKCDKEKTIESHNTVVFSRTGDSILLQNPGTEVTRLVLIAGQPVGEPVKQHGPFVMTTDEEINQAIRDYQLGLNGFEAARNWKSVAGN